MIRRRLPVKQRVLVSLLSERAIAGVLLRTFGDWLVLADAEMHITGQRAQLMDGEVYIDRARIAFVQTGVPKGR